MRRRAGYTFLVKEKSRGKTFWYVQIDHGPRFRVRAEPGTPEFRHEYDDLVGDAQRGERPSAQTKRGAASGSLAWLWDAYCRSTAWNGLAPATKRQRENIMKDVLAGAGKAPITAITRKKVLEGLDRRGATPSQANNYLKTVRGMFEWAKSYEHVNLDPTDRVEFVPLKDKGGFPEWTAEDEAKFIARWPLGTRQYLAYMVHACTGLRRGDAVRLGRQHFQEDGRIRIDTEKNGVELHIPVHDDLVAAIESCPPSGLSILETVYGRPWVKESYGNTIHEWAKEAGIAKNSHGIRKLAATRVAEAGASEMEMMALFGWKSAKMAQHYTKARDKRQLAARAGAKVGAIGAVVPLFAKRP